MKTRVHLFLVCLAAGLLLSNCGGPSSATATPSTPASATSAPTVLPQVSTAIAATGTALARLSILATSAVLATVTAPPAAATATLPTVAETPALSQPTAGTPTVTAGQPQVAEAILLLNPGNGGGVSSPVRVSGEAAPTFEQTLVIKITDASGKVLATQPTTIQGIGAVRGPFDEQVPFNVTADTPGRISVYATSARDGGLVHLASADVTLLSSCCTAPIAGQLHSETHIIQEPAPQSTIRGGRLHVSGFSDYVFESQLSLALCGEGGSSTPDEVCGTADNVLATGSALLSAPDVGQPGPFAGDLAYQVSASVSARLVVFSRSARDGGIVHLSSVPVTLAP